MTKVLNESYGVDININRIGLNWKGEVDIREAYIADHHKDTLIYSKELQTNLLNIENLIKGNLDLGAVFLDHAKLYVKTYKGEDNDNLSIFANKFSTGKPPTGEPFTLFSTQVTLTNGTIKVIDENLETPELVVLTGVNLEADDFEIIDVDIKAEINKLALKTDWGIEIKDLQGDFNYTATEISLNNMKLITEGSKLNGEISLDYSKTGSLSNFVNDVTVFIDLKESIVNTHDINVFYDEFVADQEIFIDAEVKGTLNNFTLKKSNLRTGNTIVKGDFQFENLLNKTEAYSIKGKNHSISTNYYDLRRFMPRMLGEVLPVEMKEIGRFNLTGNTSLKGNALITNSNFNSEIGQALLDLEMDGINTIDFATYNGNVDFTDFDLGKIANTTSLGKVSANLDFDGSGFSNTTVNTELSGSITSFMFEDYNYQNIVVTGNLKNPLFDGVLTIDDPNLKLEFKGLIDASSDINELDFEADVEFAELNKLNLLKRDSISVFTGNVVVDMAGLNIDDVVGTISFNQTFYQNERDNYYFDDFKVISSFDGNVRVIEINSPDIINGKIAGEFLIEDIPNLFQNGIASIYANYIPAEVTTNQYIDYEFVVHNKVVDLFVPQLKLGDNTRVKGSVSSDESKFKLDFRSPEILLFKNYLGKVNIQVDNDNPLYNTYIAVDSVYTGFYNFKDISVINKTLNDTMYVQSEFKGGEKKKDLFNLSLYHTINPKGKSVIGMKKSDITYKQNVWYLNEKNDSKNKVVFDNNFKEIRIDSLVLNHNDEIIRMAGIIKDSSYKDIKLRFHDVNIGNITPEIDSLRLQGNVNGKFDFLQKSGGYYPNSTVTIDNVQINEIPFGDLNLKIDGNEDLTQYNINTTLINEDVKSLSAVGQIDVSTVYPQIQLNVDLNEFNMQAFSPFGADVITDIRGLISGGARVSGNYKSPDILGRFTLEDSGLKIPYLNTDFDIENNTQIHVTKNKLEISKANITDTKYSTVGKLTGYATHKNFQDWELNLNIDSNDRLLVLDTPEDEDALYYGTAFISGEATIEGPVDELKIEVDATTEEGTSFKIPLSDAESIGDDSFIKFLSPAEKEARIKGEIVELVKPKALTLNFDLDINKNAEVEVVVDKVNNSTLKGRGEGFLLIRINTLGKFQMWGDFQVYEGKYDFRYGGLIQRDIEVVPGGNITWDGSPERANLNLSALYKTRANPSVLLDNPTANSKIDVDVYVDLKEQLIQPELKFRIEFPNVSSTLKSELEYKLQNEEQKQTQALFLLASNSFVNDNYGGTNAFAGTLADRVSGLVNDIFSDQDGKFVVGLDYQVANSTPEQEEAGRFGITLSTQINERILINGKVGVPVGGVNETAVAGDIEVQWLVNEDGTLRVSFFNRQADLQFIGEDQIFEQGAGISYSVDFNTISELVNKLFNKKLTLDIDEETPIVPDDSSYPINFKPQATEQEGQ